jgi:RNA polymerase-binding transcription factor DksA
MYLTEKQRKHLERRLHEERERVVRDLNRLVGELSDGTEQDRSSDLTKIPLHPADLGTDTIDTEIAASNATRESNELEEIDAALERLVKTPERFGICEDTGEKIPVERLEVIPWARTCKDAEA